MPFSPTQFAQQIFSPGQVFDDLAAALWHHQSTQNPTIQRFCELLGEEKQEFIPISFFKEFELKTAPPWEAAAVFQSSGTTGQVPSQHFVKDLSIYEETAIKGFFHFFEKKRYRILALLPSYLERQNASLVHMVKLWMDHFGLPGSGFYLYNFDELTQAIYEGAEAGEPLLLIGVAFGLLDFAEQKGPKLPQDAIVIETGGMKGRKEELVRDELHKRLGEAFGLKTIRSEYGMTELLSQFYTGTHGRFLSPPWAKVVISDIHLPSRTLPVGTTGRINIIDLANMHSCAFISTDDLGRMHEDGSFEVLGRIDGAELRGCSLMYV